MPPLHEPQRAAVDAVAGVAVEDDQPDDDARARGVEQVRRARGRRAATGSARRRPRRSPSILSRKAPSQARVDPAQLGLVGAAGPAGPGSCRPARASAPASTGWRARGASVPGAGGAGRAGGGGGCGHGVLREACGDGAPAASRRTDARSRRVRGPCGTSGTGGAGSRGPRPTRRCVLSGDVADERGTPGLDRLRDDRAGPGPGQAHRGGRRSSPTPSSNVLDPGLDLIISRRRRRPRRHERGRRARCTPSRG